MTEADTITQHWSRDNLLAASYDVNLSTFANGGNNSNNGGSNGTNKPALGVHSRENTLSRDVHHITVRTISKIVYENCYVTFSVGCTLEIDSLSPF